MAANPLAQGGQFRTYTSEVCRFGWLHQSAPCGSPSLASGSDRGGLAWFSLMEPCLLSLASPLVQMASSTIYRSKLHWQNFIKIAELNPALRKRGNLSFARQCAHEDGGSLGMGIVCSDITKPIS